MKKTYKISIKIIVIMLLTVIMALTLQKNTYATAGDFQLVQNASKTATEQANSMSAEELKTAIERFEAEINEKMNNYNGEYDNYNKTAQDIDSSKLQAYKNVYKRKTGTEYNKNSTTIGTQTGSITDPILNPSEYDPTKTQVETGKLSSIVKTLVSIMTTLGIGIALISLMIIGIRFMAGSIEERAKYKETMVPYIIGIIMVITISTIIKIMSALFFNIGA